MHGHRTVPVWGWRCVSALRPPMAARWNLKAKLAKAPLFAWPCKGGSTMNRYPGAALGCAVCAVALAIAAVLPYRAMAVQDAARLSAVHPFAQR